jgi:hypothetical protein
MAIGSEVIKQDLDGLTSEQLQQVADFVAFLKFQGKRRRVGLDAAQLATLTTEFAEEDLTLAEAGMSDYAAMLDREDEL